MRRRTPLAALLLLAACGREAPPPQNKTERPAPRPAARSAEAAASSSNEGDEQAGAKPAQVLGRYYALIEAGDYDAAWALRSGKHDEAARRRFADNFKAYARYGATVGTPSQPVEAGGWVYVEVPVMIYGSFKGGKSFGSSGSVTLRRATTAPGTGPGDRAWHIYTG